MPVMIKYDAADFQAVQERFPDLYYKQKDDCIKGELSFNARYEKQSRKNGKDNWIIVPCSSDNDCLHDCYEIAIRLSENQTGWPKVFETGGRIKRIAEEIGKPLVDLHIYPRDNSCCLGICVNSDITLYDFIVRKVYPYFVWQAYFDKYKKPPPCGEYSHDFKGIEEYLKNLKEIGRNDLCICGSGEKYKRCCIDKKQEMKDLLKKQIKK